MEAKIKSQNHSKNWNNSVLYSHQNPSEFLSISASYHQSAADLFYFVSSEDWPYIVLEVVKMVTVVGKVTKMVVLVLVFKNEAFL